MNNRADSKDIRLFTFKDGLLLLGAILLALLFASNVIHYVGGYYDNFLFGLWNIAVFFLLLVLMVVFWWEPNKRSIQWVVVRAGVTAGVVVLIAVVSSAVPFRFVVYTYGFREGIARKADIPAIDTWRQELVQSPLFKSKEIQTTEMIDIPYDQWPTAVKKIRPQRVILNRDGSLFLRFRIRNGIEVGVPGKTDLTDIRNIRLKLTDQANVVCH